MEFLDVYLHEHKVGVLSSNNGRLEFRYDPEYVQLPKAEPLSFALPVQSEPYSESALNPFFANLLPDESVRIRIAEIFRLSPENI